jgi:hypothetical protein
MTAVIFNLQAVLLDDTCHCMKFLRRLGPPVACAGGRSCPDVLLLDDGDLAIIGLDLTPHAAELPKDAGCAPNERIVRLPRNILLAALPDILKG